jgi:serine phosphatase RsbU (regulator of sigma subunit)
MIVALAGLAVPLNTQAWQWDDSYRVTSLDMDNSFRTLYITDVWKYRSGDDPSYADPDHDDSMWMPVSTLLGAGYFEFIDWSGIGWFRITLDVDSSLVGLPFALDVVLQSGASELYINGRMMYQFGQVSDRPEMEMPFQERQPRSLVFTHAGRHVLAVRYSNHKARSFVDSGFDAGFHYQLVDMNRQVANVLNMTRSATMNQYFFSGILLVFTLIHLMLFLFYSKQTQNLYFALFTASFGILTFLNYQSNFATSGLDILSIIRYQYVLIALTLTFFLRFSYSLFFQKVPKVFYGFIGAFLIAGVYIWQTPRPDMELVSMVILIPGMLEILRILSLAVIRKRDGAYIYTTGMLVFIASQSYQTLVGLGTIGAAPWLTVDTSSAIGIVALLLTMSVSLSRNFAETNRHLESKLREVEDLNTKTLEQELQKRLLEADNRRKTRELEEARDLQLSMLPRTMPDVDGMKVVPFMQTATEVGGDYYDMVVADDGSAVIAIGDATGHGLKAGLVVATAKSYFQTFARSSSNLEIIRRMSLGIKNMNLRMLYMSIALVRVQGRTLTYIGAGMPPLLLYRVSAGSVEVVTSKGMPLGSVLNYPYTEHTLVVEPGDTLVMMSDGLTESQNSIRDMLGTERVITCLQQHGSESPEQILSEFRNLIRDWSGAGPSIDDITLLTIRFI